MHRPSDYGRCGRRTHSRASQGWVFRQWWFPWFISWGGMGFDLAVRAYVVLRCAVRSSATRHALPAVWQLSEAEAAAGAGLVSAVVATDALRAGVSMRHLLSHHQQVYVGAPSCLSCLSCIRMCAYAHPTNQSEHGDAVVACV
jgi:hypothetical protein